jgi:hypothetical protein
LVLVPRRPWLLHLLRREDSAALVPPRLRRPLQRRQVALGAAAMEVVVALVRHLLRHPRQREALVDLAHQAHRLRLLEDSALLLLLEVLRIQLQRHHRCNLALKLLSRLRGITFNSEAEAVVLLHPLRPCNLGLPRNKLPHHLRSVVEVALEYLLLPHQPLLLPQALALELVIRPRKRQVDPVLDDALFAPSGREGHRRIG